MTRKPLSIQARLLAGVFGTLALVWLAATLLTWRDARHELDELLDGHLAQAAALLVARDVHDIEDGRSVDAPLLHRYAPKVAFQVFHEGRLALRSANAPADPFVALDTTTAGGLMTVDVQGQPWRVFVAHGSERDVLVYVGEQVRSRESILRAALSGTLWPTLAALPLLALGLWWAIRRSLQPLRTARGTLAARRADELRPVEVPDAPAELVPLLDALNGLLARTASLLESERRFTADAAHELRTPIAAIRAQAEVAGREPDDALRQHALQATLEGCDRATRVVEQLLTLSRLESGTATMAEVDLAGTVRSVVADLAPAALRKRQVLELDAPTTQPVKGDATLLAVLARNLIDNAIRYSPPAAQIDVTVGQLDGRVLLRVEDSGLGVSDADLQRLGQRFFRAPGHDASGTGLGWSIVQRVAQAHGATVEAGRSAVLGGFSVSIVFASA